MREHPPIPDEAWDAARQITTGPEAAIAVGALHVAAPILWREWTRGMAVVPLPEPDRDGRIWTVEDDEEICAFADADGPVVSIELGGCMAWLPAHLLRARAAAELAAADRAEQLAAEQAKAVTDAGS